MNLQEKWQPMLDNSDFGTIKDKYRRYATTVLLENQDQELRSQRQLLNEATPANVTGNVDKFDPILIELVRRTTPNLIANDVCGLQPLKMPTGLIFAMKAKYGTGATGPLSATEALFNEADTSWSGTGTHQADEFQSGSGATGPMGTYGTAVTTATAEVGTFNKMGLTIEKLTVTAKTRQLAAEYSLELAQDMKSVHELDAEKELTDILTNELLAEINREVVRTIYATGKFGAQTGTAVAGGFNLDVDSDGRWSVERFKGLLFHVEREANAVAKATRRGKGNIIICSSDVASALAMAGKLDYAPALSTDLNVDDTGNTFVGVLNGRYKVFIDPYFSSSNTTYTDILVVGYKGSNPYDAGLFYCPYVPLTKVQAIDPVTFQPAIGFKTRYGIVSNPLGADGTTLAVNSNNYYRVTRVSNVL